MRTSKCVLFVGFHSNMCYILHVFCVSDGKEYALKLIEGTGISMSACREIAVSITVTGHDVLHDALFKMHSIIYVSTRNVKRSSKIRTSIY